MVITMPQLGETVTEGTIVRWHKAVGDEVVEDDILFEVSTDKVDSEVPSPVAGIMREILVEEGETVAVGTALGRGGVVGRHGGRDPRPAGTGWRARTPARARPSSVPIHASARPGPGPGARVTREDVARRLAARSQPLPRPEPVDAPASSRARTVTAGPDDDVEPFTAIRRRTAEHMVRSLGTAAHTLVVMEVDYSGVERTRLAARDAFRAEAGYGLTALPFVARAVIDAIADFPRVNASVGDDELVVHRGVHLGIAVDLEFEGLVVPVIRDADRLRLGPLAHAMHQRATAARARTLRPDDVAGGTFTLTNAGGVRDAVHCADHQPTAGCDHLDRWRLDAAGGGADGRRRLGIRHRGAPDRQPRALVRSPCL